jgi:hypothetical protein
MSIIKKLKVFGLINLEVDNIHITHNAYVTHHQYFDFQDLIYAFQQNPIYLHLKRRIESFTLRE